MNRVLRRRPPFHRLPDRRGVLHPTVAVLGQRGQLRPDAGDDGLDPLVMLHAALGTPETLPDYRNYLLSWPDPRDRMRINPDGSAAQLGRVA